MLRRVLFTSVLWLPIAIMAWWAWGYPWWNGPWISYVSAEVSRPVVTEGETVTACISQVEGERQSGRSRACDIEWRYQVLLPCPRQIELWLEDVNGLGETLIWQHRGRTRAAGESAIASRLLLPPLAAGRYVLEAIATAECTPLYRETIRSPAVAFEVVPKGG